MDVVVDHGGVRVRRTGGFRVLALVALMGTLALAGCGRKNALEPPPSAQAVPTAAEQPAPSGWRTPSGGIPDLNATQPPPPPPATPPRNRSFPLDALLN